MPLDRFRRLMLGQANALGPVAVLVWVACVLATPLASWGWVGLQLTLVVAALLAFRAPLAAIARPLGSMAIVLGLFALLVAPGHPARIRLEYGEIVAGLLAKGLLASAGVLIWTSTTPWKSVLGSIRRIGVPARFVATLHFLERYRAVLADEQSRLARARQARMVAKLSRPRQWMLAASQVSALLVRALDRGERISVAMQARGWDGTSRGLDSLWSES
jgi:cobalt/nickel transport system permease protein